MEAPESEEWLGGEGGEGRKMIADMNDTGSQDPGKWQLTMVVNWFSGEACEYVISASATGLLSAANVMESAAPM